MDTTTANLLMLSIVSMGGAVAALAAVAMAALRRSPPPPQQPAPQQYITATSGAQVTIDQAQGNLVKRGRLPTTTIAALEDALSYLVQAKDIMAGVEHNGNGVGEVIGEIQHNTIWPPSFFDSGATVSTARLCLLPSWPPGIKTLVILWDILMMTKKSPNVHRQMSSYRAVNMCAPILRFIVETNQQEGNS